MSRLADILALVIANLRAREGSVAAEGDFEDVREGYLAAEGGALPGSAATP